MFFHKEPDAAVRSHCDVSQRQKSRRPSPHCSANPVEPCGALAEFCFDYFSLDNIWKVILEKEAKKKILQK